MSDFIANSQMYSIASETELAIVLAHYNSDFIFSIMRDALDKRYDIPNILPNPNVVAAWEQNFKDIQSQYNSSETMESINRVRSLTYKEIIETICKEFNLNFTISDDVDLYSAAYWLYDFFVANFTTNIVSFFTNFIFKERNNIYDYLGLAEFKKNKDSSTTYGKKIFKDIKLAVINANIDMVVSAISEYEIDIINILNNTISDKNISSYIWNIVSANDDFFKMSYVSILHTDMRPAYITNIRIHLQELSKYTETVVVDDTTNKE